MQTRNSIVKILLLFFIVLSISLFSSCTLTYRYVRYGGADIDDYQIFPAYNLCKSEKPFRFSLANPELFDSLITKSKDSLVFNIEENLKMTSTRAFLVIRNDSVLFQYYKNGIANDDVSTVFSVSKSITSLMIGIAIDEGVLSSVDDPVTKYIPELAKKHPNYSKLTIRHLLNMRSGLNFSEKYENPFAKMARLYYGRNQWRHIQRLGFDSEPGTKHEYQSATTALLSLVLERASGKTMAQYFEKKVWKNLDAENNASWSLDDEKHRSTKSYSGFNVSAIDLAKIGRIYLNGGEFEGKRIVSSTWIDETFTISPKNNAYQYQWYNFAAFGTDSAENKYFTDSLSAAETFRTKYKKFDTSNIWKHEKENWRLTVYTNQFYALGIMQQIMFIDPQKNLIIIRMGGGNDFPYLGVMYRLATVL